MLLSCQSTPDIDMPLQKMSCFLHTKTRHFFIRRPLNIQENSKFFQKLRTSEQDNVGAARKGRKFASSKPETLYGSSGPSEDGHQLLIDIRRESMPSSKVATQSTLTSLVFSDRLSCLSRRKCQSRTAAAPMLHAACAITLRTLRLDKDKLDASIGEVLWLFSARQ